MTSRIAAEALAAARRQPKARKAVREVLTMEGVFRAELAAQVHATTRIVFPSPVYRKDPVKFFHDILGVEPWSRQVEIIEAVRDHKRVAVRSGHKISKSHTAAGISLWFYCSFEDARVVMTSTTSRQVDDILWREAKMMRARSGLCFLCKIHNKQSSLADHIQAPCEHSSMIDGEMGDLARTGLKSADFREIKGFTAREAEAVAGISGANLLYLLDEASGIKEEIFEAIEGNRAGGARIVMFSNPTKPSGEFYEAFHSKKDYYHSITVSSEETPNVVYGDDDPRAIPGLASREWIEEKKREWGEDSALYSVRVKGEHTELDEGRIFSIHLIGESEERWSTTPEDGRLFIGLDPAGDGPSGDETAWVCRRGFKQIAIVTKRGLSTEAIFMHTLGLVREYRHDTEIPVVVLDREGAVGAKVYGHFSGVLSSMDDPPFEAVGVRASNKAKRMPLIYDRMRDELAAVHLDWIKDGGAIITDTKMAQELQQFEWIELTNGKVKITPKKEVKEKIGRSPDRYDAAVLSTWVPSLAGKGSKPPRKQTIEDRPDTHVPMDPYAASDQIFNT